MKEIEWWEVLVEGSSVARCTNQETAKSLLPAYAKHFHSTISSVETSRRFLNLLQSYEDGVENDKIVRKYEASLEQKRDPEGYARYLELKARFEA